MVKKLLAILIVFMLFMAMAPLKVFAAAPKAAADGSFIQWWLVKDWSDERWINECNALKEAGMHYLILAPTAFYVYDETTKTGKTQTIYPTKQDGFEVLKDENGVDYPDVVDACLRNAQKAGIKVFLGLNFSDDWWNNQHNPDWVNARMEEGNKVADELWNLYHDKYADTFYGWYWCWEVDNHAFTKSDSYNSKQILTDAIKIQLDHLDAVGRHLPFMLAPFMNWTLGTPDDYAQMWQYVFAYSGLKEGDIFCPQDCIGAGGLNLSNYVDWFAALRKAVDTKPGLQFWSDNETFVAADWTSATLDRFVQQLQDLQPYVDNYVTFAYSHYYSPYNTDPGFQKTYLEYLNTGTLEKTPPTTPANFRADLQPTGNVSLSWDAATDDNGVCGYYVYRDGKKIANKQVQKIDDGKNAPVPLTSLVDGVLKPDTTYVYEVQAYDFAGNVSAKSDPITVTTGTFQYMPNNISKGRLYKVTPEAHKNYPDTGRKELTDGIYGNAQDFFDPAWQGWFNNPREVIVGLVQRRPVQQFVIGYLRDPGPTIVLPAKITVSVSDDGINYTKVGDFPTPNVPADDPPARFSYCLTLDSPVDAKYVKFNSTPGGGWTFVDEVEVRNNGDQYNNDDIVNDLNDPILSYNNTSGNTGLDLSNKISEGCKYNVTPSADANYPDTNGTELTDGKSGDATDPYDPAWQNWWHADNTPTVVTLDLGLTKKVEQVTADFLKLSSWGIQLPKSITVSTSTDGVNYTDVGTMPIPANAQDNSNVKLRLTLPTPLQAQYIKLTVDTNGSNVFVDEVEVRNSVLDLPVLISGGKGYTVDPGANANFPDTNSGELTDGVYGSSDNPGDPAWQGWYTGTNTVVVNLESVKEFRQVSADFLKYTAWGIQMPDSVKVFASTDGVNYTELGSAAISSSLEDSKNHKLYVTLNKAVNAQYIKLVVGAGGNWVFIDEVEVRDSDLIPPSISVSLTGTDWTNEDVSVTPSFIDEGGSGLALRQFAWSSSQESPGTWETADGTQLVQKNDGIWYLNLKATDGAGNITTERYGPYKIDKTAPSISEHIANEVFLGESLKLEFDASDELSGIKREYIDFNGKTYSNGDEIHLDEPGNYKITMVAEDNAGNIKTLEKELEVIIPAQVELDPQTINSDSNGMVTAYIKLPGGLNLNAIKLDSIRLNNQIAPITDTKYGYVLNPVNDYDHDGQLEFMAKFKKEDVLKIMTQGKNNVTMSGSVGSCRFNWTGSLDVIK